MSEGHLIDPTKGPDEPDPDLNPDESADPADWEDEDDDAEDERG